MTDKNYPDFNDMLMERALGVLNNTISVSDLIGAFPAIEDALRAMRQDYDAAVKMERPDVQEYCRESIGKVHKFFDEYMREIDQLESYGSRFDALSFENEIKKIGDIYNSLNIAFLLYRNDALIARGPSSHGGLNYVIQTVDRILNEEDAYDELSRIVYAENYLAGQTVMMLNSAEQNVFNVGQKAFYTNYQNLLQHIQLSIDGRDPSAFGSLRESFVAWGEYYRRFDITYHVKAYSNTPTSLPMANLVINAARNYLGGAGESDVFLYFLNELKLLFGKVKFRYDEIATRSGPTTVLEQEESAVLERTMKNIGRAIIGFDIFIETGDMKHFSHSERLLYSSAEAFAASIRKLQDMADDSGKVTCFRCGHKNVAGEVFCKNCRGLLPQVESREQPSMVNAILDEGIRLPEEATEPQMTVYVNEIFQAAANLAQGSIAVPEFEGLLAEMENRLRDVSARVREVPPLTAEAVKELGKKKAEQTHSLLQEAHGAFDAGIKEFEESIFLFHEFSATLSTGTMESAKGKMWQGAVNLQEAQQILKQEFKTEDEQ